MSINMYVGEVRQQVQSINSSCHSTIETMEQIQQALSTIIIEPSLKGATYDSMKSYFNTVYMPVTKGFILVCERMIEANQQFLNRYLDQVDVNSLQESVLEERIRQYNRLSEMLDSIVDPVGFNARMIDGLQEMRQQTVRKLDALREYDYFSIQIFDELEAQLSTLEAGVTILSEGKAWNQSTGTFSTMGLNLDWAGEINQSWKDHQKKKDKDHEAKLLNELKNAKIYYANNNGKKVWYIMKDGKLVDANKYSHLLDGKYKNLVEKGYNINEMKISKDIVLVPNRGVVGSTSSIFGGGFALRNAQDIGSTIIGASLLTEQLLNIQVSKTKEGDGDKIAPDFEKEISHLSKEERIPKIREKAKEVAEKNGWKRNKALERKNSGRRIYTDEKTKKNYSVDTLHGRFEESNNRGKHQGEIDFDLNSTEGPDQSGGHDLNVK